MQFVDKARIYIKAGDGGDGCASFHREKYVQRGGPDGGDGGRGGSVIFVADRNMSTLLDFKYSRHFRAQRGENGRAQLQRGKSGEDMVIHVPIGTLVRDVESGRIMVDMNSPGRERVLLHGGRGGRGNARFATPTHQAPRFAQPGQKTREYEVELELKTIADVGLIGLPNVGKSTILSVLTSARPKIANYHFTTLTPNLGVVKRYDKTFVLADIPGLIEGAADGAGLGHDFLRHVERTRMLVHVVDISGCEGRDPIEDYYQINRELERYSERLAQLPQIVAANKMDITGAEEYLHFMREELGDAVKLFPVSAATTSGFDALLDEIVCVLATVPKSLEYDEEDYANDRSMYPKGFEVAVEDGVFVVTGGTVDYLLDTTNANDEYSMRRFQKYLINEGIVEALRAAGATDESVVRMGDWEFDVVE
ncbi:MAG: GTPase ObgE [Clostridia bacterium]|nr:GTPase ObgE [Clostridia bacterium]